MKAGLDQGTKSTTNQLELDFSHSYIFEKKNSHNLQRLHLKITENEKRVSKCKHEGKSCKQNVTRGFFKTWMIAYLVKYAIGVLPALLTGKAMKK